MKKRKLLNSGVKISSDNYFEIIRGETPTMALIYFFTYYSPPGNDAASIGIDRILRELAKKNKIYVFLPYKDKIKKIENVVWVRSPQLPKFLSYNLSFLFLGVIAILNSRKHKPDVVFSQYHPHHFCSLAALIFSKFKNLPWIVRAHDVIPSGDISFIKNKYIIFSNKINLILGKMADRFLVTNEGARDFLFKKGFDKRKIGISPNGVDTSVFKNLESTAVEDYVLFIGGLYVEEGIENLIMAFNKVSNNQKDIILKIVGTGSEYTNLKKLIENLFLQKKIFLLGEFEYNKMPSFIQNSKFCIGPLKKADFSKTTIPRKIVEYMSCGKTVISVEISRDIDKTCYIQTDGSVEDLTNKLKFLINNDIVINKIGRRARSLIERRFEWSSILDNLLIDLENVQKRR